MDDYFIEIKKNMEEQIPEFDSPEFKKMRDTIQRELQKKESDFLILVRRLKILILGDWYTKEKRHKLIEIKNTLLKNGLYCETVDTYYDLQKKGGLSQIQILESCCINHQLIVFIDGDGKGTITEQNYLCQNYMFHGKIIFFIDEEKFNKLKANPNEYLKSFPTIIPCKPAELTEKF